MASWAWDLTTWPWTACQQWCLALEKWALERERIGKLRGIHSYPTNRSAKASLDELTPAEEASIWSLGFGWCICGWTTRYTSDGKEGSYGWDLLDIRIYIYIYTVIYICTYSYRFIVLQMVMSPQVVIYHWQMAEVLDPSTPRGLWWFEPVNRWIRMLDLQMLHLHMKASWMFASWHHIGKLLNPYNLVLRSL